MRRHGKFDSALFEAYNLAMVGLSEQHLREIYQSFLLLYVGEADESLLSRMGIIADEVDDALIGFAEMMAIKLGEIMDQPQHVRVNAYKAEVQRKADRENERGAAPQPKLLQGFDRIGRADREAEESAALAKLEALNSPPPPPPQPQASSPSLEASAPEWQQQHQPTPALPPRLPGGRLVACRRVVEFEALLGALAWTIHLPSLPLLVVGPLAASPVVVGLLFGAFTLSALASSASVPLLLNHLTPRTLFLVSGALRIISSALHLIAVDWAAFFELHDHAPPEAAVRGFTLLLWARVLHGLSSFSFVVALTWLGHALPPDLRAEATSTAHGATLLGSTAGPALGCLLAGTFAGGIATAARTAAWTVMILSFGQGWVAWQHFELGGLALPRQPEPLTSFCLPEWRQFWWLISEQRPVAIVCAAGGILLAAASSIEVTFALVLASSFGWQAADSMLAWLAVSSTSLAATFASTFISRGFEQPHTTARHIAGVLCLFGTALCVPWLDMRRAVGWGMTLIGLLALGVGNSLALSAHSGLLVSSLPLASHADVTRLLQLVCQLGRALGPPIALGFFQMGMWLGGGGKGELSLSSHLTAATGNTNLAPGAAPAYDRFTMLACNLTLLCYCALSLAGVSLTLMDGDATQQALGSVGAGRARDLSFRYNRLALDHGGSGSPSR